MRRVSKSERAFRRGVAIEFIQSGKSREEIALKYGLPAVHTVSNWVNSYLSPYEIKNKCLSLQPEELISERSMAQDVTEEQRSQSEEELLRKIASLEKTINRLESSLKRAEDRNLALNTMIDIAEEQGMRIRKKSGVKR